MRDNNVDPSFVPVTMADGGVLTFARTETTFDQWQECRKAGACKADPQDHGWGKGDRPVINVSWSDAADYAAWIGRRTGRACRLPSESEWEHAARAGIDAPFWWGADPKKGPANCRDCGAGPIYGTVPAGSLPANPYGLHEMNGNVWEWANDCWRKDRAAPVSSAASCAKRVIKGGSWYYYAANARWDARAGNDPRTGSYNIGFRVVCETDQANSTSNAAH